MNVDKWLRGREIVRGGINDLPVALEQDRIRVSEVLIMAQSGQSYRNHARWFPPFHFFVLPVLLVNVFISGYLLYSRGGRLLIWELVVSLALLMLALTARRMALAVQDRLIRLEVRLRLREVLPADMHARIPEITPEQCVGLRFASDAELAALANRVLSGEIKTRSEIKKAIVQWEADHLRA